jgi:poly(3-hydroxybutyrate) depolymerase
MIPAMADGPRRRTGSVRSPIFQTGGRRRRVRRHRFAAVAALIVVVIVAALVVPWIVDEVRDSGRADPRGALVADLEIDSSAVGEELDTTVVVPRGAQATRAKRPLLIFLHGSGGDNESQLGDETMFAALDRLGARAPIVAFPDGDSSYWHNRDDGDWADYVIDEVIPRVARSVDADPRRVAIGGISMGGFGAYDLALHDPGRFCAVGGHSPALWSSAGEAAPGAFDDAKDFARNDVVGAARGDAAEFLRIPVWLDAGDEDPFQPGDRAFIGALRAGGADLSANTKWPGGHDRDYWEQHWLAYFRFYSRELSDCDR